jgi:hypothetical protein
MRTSASNASISLAPDRLEGRQRAHRRAFGKRPWGQVAPRGARRLVAAQGIASEAAAAAIATSDRNRRDYFRRFYDIGQEQPTHYDLVVNTDVVTPEQAAEVIVCAAQGRP